MDLPNLGGLSIYLPLVAVIVVVVILIVRSKRRGSRQPSVSATPAQAQVVPVVVGDRREVPLGGLVHIEVTFILPNGQPVPLVVAPDKAPLMASGARGQLSWLPGVQRFIDFRPAGPGQG